MKKILPAVFFTLSHLWLHGQDITRTLSQSEADKLKHSLPKSIPDAEKTDILLRLALFNIFKPGSEKTDVDSAKNFIRQAEPIVMRLKSAAFEGYLYYVLANLSRETGDINAGKEFAAKALARLKDSGDEYHLALTYAELVNYEKNDNADDVKGRVHLTELAVHVLLHSRHIELRAFLLKNLAELYFSIDDNEKAQETIQKSLDEYQTIHYPQLQGVYTLFGIIDYATGNYQRSLRYMFKALKAAETTKDTTMQLCQTYNVIGIIYNQLDEHKNAIPYFIRAMEIARRNQNMDGVLTIMWNLVVDYIKIKGYSQALELVGRVKRTNPEPARDGLNLYVPLAYLHIYLAQGNYIKAGPYCNQLQQTMKNYRSREPSTEISIYNDLIKYYLHEGKLDLARKYLSTNDAVVMSIKEPAKIRDQYWNRFRVDSAGGDFKGAMNNLLKFRWLNDSLFTEKKSQQIKQIEAEYQTKKKEIQLKVKDQAIRLLQQKEQIQQRGLQNANLIKNFTFGGILLLLVISALLYRQFRLKQKSNEIAQRNNVIVTQKNELLERLLKEKEWLLKEVHHRVKNNLHTVICLLESQALYLENDALKAIENSQHRIYAMSLIHQKLYQAEDIKTIDMSIYLPEFIQYLNESFGTQRQVRFHLEIEPIQLGVSQAIPLALIINEAVTNSIKYAFTPDIIGIISVSMSQHGQEIALIVADNGIGLDPTITDMPLESLGLKLMNGLSEDINAHISFENYKGTRITILFNVDPLNNQHHFSGTLNQD